MPEHLRLRPFTVADEAVARAAQAELAADDFSFLLDTTPGQSWADYVVRLGQIARGEGLVPDRVPAALLAAEVDGEVVGRASVRYRLDDWWAAFGGHIGYGVRPALRRRGYATAVLRESLDVARGVGVTSALVCCDDTNVGSAAVIERCGGVLDDLVRDGSGRLLRRYLIDTAGT